MSVESNLRTAAETLVREWYRQWAGLSRTPTRREVEQAVGLIDDYGLEMAKEMIAILVAIMKESWPDAVRFGSVFAYVAEAVHVMEQKNTKAATQLRQDAENIARDVPSSIRRTIWLALPEEMRQKIRETILKSRPKLRNDAEALDRECEFWVKRFIP